MFKAAVLSLFLFLSLWFVPAYAGDAGFGVQIIIDVATGGPEKQSRLSALQALIPFAEKTDVLEAGRKIFFDESQPVEIKAAALNLIHKYFERTAEVKIYPTRGLEIMKEIWAKEKHGLLWNWLWSSQFGTEMENFLLDTLKYLPFTNQLSAMEFSGYSVHVIKSPLIDLEIKRISETAQYAKERQIAAKQLSKRADQRTDRGISFPGNSIELGVALHNFAREKQPAPEGASGLLQDIHQHMLFLETVDHSRLDQLSFEVYKAALNALTPQEILNTALQTGPNAFGGVHPRPPWYWSDRNLQLTFFEEVVAKGEDFQKLALGLFPFSRQKITDYASERVWDGKLLFRIFSLAAKLPSGWDKEERIDLVRFTIFGLKPDPRPRALKSVDNVISLLYLLPEHLQAVALESLGQSRRAGSANALVEASVTLKPRALLIAALKGLSYSNSQGAIATAAHFARMSAQDRDRSVRAAALISLASHYSAARHFKVEPDPMAAEKIRELWEMTNAPQIQRNILEELGPVNEPVIEEIFLAALDSKNLFLQQLAIENSTAGKRIAESERIDAKLAEMLSTVGYPRIIYLLHKTIAARKRLRESQAACEAVVTHVEGHENKFLE